MRPFNVEIFDRNFNFIHNYTVESPVYKYDYLTPVENSVTISFNKDVTVGQYIVVANNKRRYEGVISSLQVINKSFMTVGYYPLNSLFSYPIYLDIGYQQGGQYQGQKSIESIIYEQIKRAFIDGYYSDYYISGEPTPVDNLQKIPGLTLTKTTDTYIWNVGLSLSNSYIEDRWEGNLYSDLIPRALKGCSVGVITELDINAKKVYCTIGVINSNEQTIEADLPHIIQKNVVENDTSLLCNKYVMIPPSETSEPIKVYYRHSDGLWDLNNTDRLFPVITEVGEPLSDIYEGDPVEVRLFNQYGALKYVNLIELTTIIDTYDLDFGDVANIIVGNKIYVSMLTGYEIKDDIIKLIFGMLRLDLTKILKGRKF